MDSPGLRPLHEAGQRLGHLRGIEDRPHLFRGLRQSSQEVPAHSSGLFYEPLPHDSAIHDEQPERYLRRLELHQEVPHRSTTVTVPPIGEVEERRVVVAAHHDPDVHLGAGLMVRIVADLGDRAGDAEEQYIREVVGHDLLLTLRQGMEFPPPCRQSDVEVSGVVDPLGDGGFVVADGVEGIQKIVLGERLVREPGENGKVGGGDPGAELGGTLRVENSVDRPGSEMGAWRGGVRDRTSAPNSVDLRSKLQILGQGPEQPNRPGPARILVLHPIQDGSRPFLLAASLGAETTNELADDLLSLSVGAPLLEVDSGAPLPSLDC